MAKVKSMNNRNLIGTLGGAVYYMRAGENVAREKAAFVTNPRSTSQMNQRVRLANLVNFYRANRAWMFRGAFENKPAKLSDYNAFVSRNIQTSDIALTKAEANAGAVIADTYQVTDGSLPMANVSASGRTALLSTPGALAEDGNGALDFVTNIYNTYPGIQPGDQLSFIVLLNKRDGSGIPRLSVRAFEMTLIASSANTEAENAAELFANNDGNVTILAANGGYSFGYTAPTDTALAYAICFSRTTQSGIKVSPSFVVLTDDTFKDGYSSAEQFQKAIDSYGESVANFLDSGSVTAGDSNTPSGDDDQGGSGAGDPGDVTP